MARRTQFYMLIIFAFFVISINADNCHQISPCSCQYDDGRKIDLKQFEEKPFLTATTLNNLKYYFHPCTDKKPSFPKGVNIINAGDCDNTSLCLLNSTGNTTAFNLGNAKDVKFSSATNSQNYLVFNHNQSNTTIIIYMICTPYYEESILYFNQNDSNNTQNLIFFSKANCPFFDRKGLSTGSVLVIIFLTFSAIYFLAGAALLHFLRGARGKEMIPNIEFWIELPLLVRDGAVFLQNGCKPVISNSDSYDRI